MKFLVTLYFNDGTNVKTQCRTWAEVEEYVDSRPEWLTVIIHINR